MSKDSGTGATAPTASARTVDSAPAVVSASLGTYGIGAGRGIGAGCGLVNSAVVARRGNVGGAR